VWGISLRISKIQFLALQVVNYVLHWKIEWDGGSLFTEALMKLNDLQIWMWRCVGGNGCVFAFGKKL
jgi:hypothetical protein